MGAATSTELQLKLLLHDHEADAKNKDAELQVEEAVHMFVASELESGQHLQQLQIALELLLLHVRPEAWSSTASSQVYSADEGEEDAVTSATSNSAGWSACHRACATGNLALVAFVLQHYRAQFELQTRCNMGHVHEDEAHLHTMQGADGDRGLVYRAAELIYSSVAQQQHIYEFQVSVQIVGVYNEEINDLLASPDTTGNNGSEICLK
ncbi:hypothetical protein PHYSODRAFT_248072 [Phytophthora sojae]|uniref:Kinesin motor domain-containing protein n=1 Tax=Phytophthora sojae (strain P6497) TaxID=1094619 RepID=G5AGS8_PHYSP|nr:hypothetical protein PHYSODRAFT_248072 [Phytophthora sojae]EGZ05358.1 hypothetical protein PHYSODRAFT_248072 [Phytophthora sojae]|eukprot:XP_009539279.1 hypothetical protein PHYSODRAFT_248072 [Phytophthora sojae]